MDDRLGAWPRMAQSRPGSFHTMNAYFGFFLRNGAPGCSFFGEHQFALGDSACECRGKMLRIWVGETSGLGIDEFVEVVQGAEKVSEHSSL